MYVSICPLCPGWVLFEVAGCSQRLKWIFHPFRDQMCRENHSGLPGTRQQDSLVVDKLWLSHPLLEPPDIPETHQPGAGWAEPWGAERICTGNSSAGPWETGNYLEVRLLEQLP